MEHTIPQADRDNLDILLPRTTVLQRAVDGAQHVFMGAPVLADVDKIVTSEDWDDGALTIAAQPDVPRNLTVTVTDADTSITGGICTIVGKDSQGRAISEVMDITDGLSWTGTKIFATVTSATISGTTGVPATGTDVVTVGVGNVIGLPVDLSAEAEVIRAYVAAAPVTPDAIATGESTSGIDCNGATYDGSKLMWAIVKLGES